MTIVDQVFFLVLGVLDAGFAMVMPVVLATFAITFGWAITRLAFAWLAGSMENIVGDLIGLFIVFWLFVAVAWSAKEIVDAAGNFALVLGSSIVGADGSSRDLFAPSAMWDIADGQVDKILKVKLALCTGTWECLRARPEMILRF